jgi:hypothetical protein
VVLLRWHLVLQGRKAQARWNNSATGCWPVLLLHLLALVPLPRHRQQGEEPEKLFARLRKKVEKSSSEIFFVSLLVILKWPRQGWSNTLLLSQVIRPLLHKRLGMLGLPVLFLL